MPFLNTVYFANVYFLFVALFQRIVQANFSKLFRTVCLCL